jgi:dTDP-4-dehydrorhamnose reductase
MLNQSLKKNGKISMSKVLVLGDGLLGNEIIKQTGWDCVSRKKTNFNVDDLESSIPSGYNIILNCIANTNTYSEDKEGHWTLNYKFVYNLINYCNSHNIKLIHISTDYIYTGSDINSSENDVPVHCNNWYGYTKLLGDGLVQLLSNNYLLCRCTHKPKPFPYENAWVDQIGNFDYVDKISELIIKLINDNKNGLYNVGTESKSMYDLASQTKSVAPINSPSHIPKNTTMNIDKLNNKPFFSIAIPTYGYNGRGSEFLDFSLDIISKQTFTDFEVVISDHSTDDTIYDVVKRWEDKLVIKYVKNEIGRGIISPNINNALSLCQGKWIKVLFQDDFLYDETSLENQSNFIKNSDNSIQWLMTKFYHSDDGINFYRLYHPVWNDNIWTGLNTMGCPSGMTIKNNDLIYFDNGLNWLMDCDYYQKMFLKYGEPYILDKITVVNRTWGSRLTDTIPQSLKDKEFNILKERYDRTT